MEIIGAINKYVPYKWTGESIFTINLATGTTPFIGFFNKREYTSNFYKITGSQKITITEGWYRPNKEEFDKLSEDIQEHILNGGLLHKPLIKAIDNQMSNDPVQLNWDYEPFQEWCLSYYKKRL